MNFGNNPPHMLHQQMLYPNQGVYSQPPSNVVPVMYSNSYGYPPAYVPPLPNPTGTAVGYGGNQLITTHYPVLPTAPPPPPPPPGPPPNNEPDNPKIAMLQHQARIWQEQKRAEEEREKRRKQERELLLKNLAQTKPDVKTFLDEEELFNDQYSSWKTQMNDWKEANKDHPDKELFKQYEDQWKVYEREMDAKREELEKRKDDLIQMHSSMNTGVEESLMPQGGFLPTAGQPKSYIAASLPQQHGAHGLQQQRPPLAHQRPPPPPQQQRLPAPQQQQIPPPPPQHQQRPPPPQQQQRPPPPQQQQIPSLLQQQQILPPQQQQRPPPPQQQQRLPPPQQQQRPPPPQQQQRPPFSQQQHQPPTSQQQQRPPITQQQQRPLLSQQQQRPPLSQQNERPLSQQHQRPPFSHQQGPPFAQHQKPPTSQGQRPTLGSQTIRGTTPNQSAIPSLMSLETVMPNNQQEQDKTRPAAPGAPGPLRHNKPTAQMRPEGPPPRLPNQLVRPTPSLNSVQGGPPGGLRPRMPEQSSQMRPRLQNPPRATPPVLESSSPSAAESLRPFRPQGGVLQTRFSNQSQQFGNSRQVAPRQLLGNQQQLRHNFPRIRAPFASQSRPFEEPDEEEQEEYEEPYEEYAQDEDLDEQDNRSFTDEVNEEESETNTSFPSRSDYNSRDFKGFNAKEYPPEPEGFRRPPFPRPLGPPRAELRPRQPLQRPELPQRMRAPTPRPMSRPDAPPPVREPLPRHPLHRPGVPPDVRAPFLRPNVPSETPMRPPSLRPNIPHHEPRPRQPMIRQNRPFLNNEPPFERRPLYDEEGDEDFPEGDADQEYEDEPSHDDMADPQYDDPRMSDEDYQPDAERDHFNMEPRPPRPEFWPPRRPLRHPDFWDAPYDRFRRPLHGDARFDDRIELPLRERRGFFDDAYMEDMYHRRMRSPVPLGRHTPPFPGMRGGSPGRRTPPGLRDPFFPERLERYPGFEEDIHRHRGEPEPDPAFDLGPAYYTSAQPVEIIDYSHRIAHRQSQDDSFRRDRSPLRRAPSPPPPAASRPPVTDLFDAYSVVSVPQVTDIRDLILKPKRDSRPPHICLIVRGAPGAGKTYTSKLIRDKESANGGSAPRILNLDDYFMVEVERLVTDEETGKKVKKKMLEYEYEAEMEESYRADFLKSFKKTVEKGYFSFIIIDAVNDKIRHFDEFAKFARQKGFQVYIVDVKADAQTCFSRNTHNRSLKDIETIIAGWEETPPYFNKIDLSGLLQEDAIDEVEMADKSISDSSDDDDDDDDLIQVAQKSKWEADGDDLKLNKLDGLLHKKADVAKNMEDFLAVDEDYERKPEDGKKHVRWADVEEKRLQQREREIGFVVGHTNWNRMLDDDYADKQLNKTKYI